MFDLGVPFGVFLIYAVLWVVGYFVWAVRSAKKLEQTTDTSPEARHNDEDEG